MEPLQRRSLGGMPERRPIMGGVGGPAPMRPSRIGQPVAPARPSALRPPVVPQPAPANTMQDLRPASSAASPMAATAQPHTTTPGPHSAFTPPQTTPQAAPVHHAATPDTFAAPTNVEQPQAQTATTPSVPTPSLRDGAKTSKPADEHVRAHKGPHSTGHAGLVGFIVFIAMAALFFAPLLPGKIWDNAPGSSQGFSTGDQNIDCLGTLGKTTTTTSYDLKAGFPLIYDYSTTSHLSATCDGKLQRAVGGHTSQFNPLAVATNFVLALAIAITTAKLWRRFRGVRD